MDAFQLTFAVEIISLSRTNYEKSLSGKSVAKFAIC